MISDQGVGMRPEQLEELNAILRDPPVTGLALGRSLGCLVAARLAARHGITVRLRAGEGDGLAAYVVLPRSLLVEEAAAPIADAACRSTPLLPAPAEPRPERLEEALPRADFDAGLQALLEEEDSDGAERDKVEALTEVPMSPAPPATVLTRRVPGATTEALPEPPVEPPVRRNPDEVRALLSRYRSGLEAGRGADENDPGPADEERS